MTQEEDINQSDSPKPTRSHVFRMSYFDVMQGKDRHVTAWGPLASVLYTTSHLTPPYSPPPVNDFYIFEALFFTKERRKQGRAGRREGGRKEGEREGRKNM